MPLRWKQYSGMWTRQQQMQAASASTWPGVLLTSTLWNWGRNNLGQLGQNNLTYRSSPTQVGSQTDWSYACSGQESSFAIKTNGTLWAWGKNNYGVLGQGNIIDRSSPVQVGALTNWSTIDQFYLYSPAFALKTDGTLWSWGINGSGQLGQNNVIDKSSPVQVGSLTDWQSVSSGASACFAIKTDGTLWSWGQNTDGILARNNITYYVSSPVQVGSQTNWSMVSLSNTSALAVKTDGTMWSWGRNQDGQLGQNNVISRSSPTQVGALTNWKNASITASVAAAIKTDGTLWSWGLNSSGQLGQNNTTQRSSPVQVGSLTTWLTVSCMYNTMFALSTNQTMWVWGANEFGRLGLNLGAAYRSSPVQIGSNTNWYFISRAYYSPAAIAKTFVSG